MRMLVLSASLTLTWGTAGLVGCSAEHVTAVEDTEALVSEGEPVPGDPWGVCDLEWACSNPAAGCRGWVEPGSCETAECDVERFLIGCLHWCETSADCPVPLSGDAEPVCMAGVCSLSCGDGATCPNGNSCVAAFEYQGPAEFASAPPYLCMQVYGPEAVGPGYMPPVDEQP